MGGKKSREGGAQKALLISPTVPWAIKHIGASANRTFGCYMVGKLLARATPDWSSQQKQARKLQATLEGCNPKLSLTH